MPTVGGLLINHLYIHKHEHKRHIGYFTVVTIDTYQGCGYFTA